MGGLGTDGRGGSAAGPSSSVCVLIVLSGGIHYAWVACRHCLREAHHCLWVGVVGCGHWVVVLFVGSGRRLWVWGSGHGRWVIVPGHWVVVGGVGLLIGGGGAPLCGWVAHGCWFVVCGRSGDVLFAVWSALVRLEGMRVGVLTIDDSITNNKQRQCRHSLFSCHIALSNMAPANCPFVGCVDTG